MWKTAPWLSLVAKLEKASLQVETLKPGASIEELSAAVKQATDLRKESAVAHASAKLGGDLEDLQASSSSIAVSMKEFTHVVPSCMPSRVINTYIAKLVDEIEEDGSDNCVGPPKLKQVLSNTAGTDILFASRYPTSPSMGSVLYEIGRSIARSLPRAVVASARAGDRSIVRLIDRSVDLSLDRQAIGNKTVGFERRSFLSFFLSSS